MSWPSLSARPLPSGLMDERDAREPMDSAADSAAEEPPAYEPPPEREGGTTFFEGSEPRIRAVIVEYDPNDGRHGDAADDA